MLYGYKRGTSKSRTYCRCIGIDGNEYIVRADSLTCGATKHIKGVGTKKIAKDIAGQQFGHLTALYPTDKRAANGSVIWHCVCDCGNYVDVTMNNLVRGHTRSCGCNKRSKYEEFICEHLKSIGVEFEEEKRFQKCKNLKGSDMLPFDFYIPKYNLLIEFDGQHHFEPISGWGGEEKFKLTQRNDGIKNKFCLENNFTLLRIPYTDSDEEIRNKINSFVSPVTTTA